LLTNNYRDVLRVFDQDPKAQLQLEDIFRHDAELDQSGGPIGIKANEWGIDLPDGDIHFIVHRGGPCAGGFRSIPGWNIPEGTVTEISFYPAFKKPITVDQLPFSIAGFEKMDYQGSATYYRNNSEGMEVHISGNTVQEVGLFPRDDMWFMRCHTREEAEVIDEPLF